MMRAPWGGRLWAHSPPIGLAGPWDVNLIMCVRVAPTATQQSGSSSRPALVLQRSTSSADEPPGRCCSSGERTAPDVGPAPPLMKHPTAHPPGINREHGL